MRRTIIAALAISGVAAMNPLAPAFGQTPTARTQLPGQKPAAAPPAPTASTQPDAPKPSWWYFRTGDGVTAWGDVSADKDTGRLEGSRFLAFDKEQKLAGGVYRWVVQSFELDCRLNMFAVPDGDYFGSDGKPVAKGNPVPMFGITPNSPEFLMKIAMCDGRSISGGRAAADLSEAVRESKKLIGL